MAIVLYLLIVILILIQTNAKIKLSFSSPLSSKSTNESAISKSKFTNSLFIKGGKYVPKKKAKKVDTKKKKSFPLKDQLNKIQPATRCYMLLALVCMLIHVSGLPAPALLSVDINKFYEIWRPFTSVAYFGAPSLSTANSIYFLIQYGQQLETLNGTGAHAWFLLIQTIILSIIGMIFQFPLLAQSMIAATVYVSCRLNPLQQM